MFVLWVLRNLIRNRCLPVSAIILCTARLQVEYLLTSKVDAIMKVLKYIFSMMLLGGIISACADLDTKLTNEWSESDTWRDADMAQGVCYLFIRMS